MAVTHLSWATDDFKFTKTIHYLFLDSESEVNNQPPLSGLPLMTRKRTATLLQTTEEFLSILEFFAGGNEPTAVLFRAVKGGDNLPKHLISAIIKVHLSFFYLLSFFIGHLTLSFYVYYFIH